MGAIDNLFHDLESMGSADIDVPLAHQDQLDRFG